MKVRAGRAKPRDTASVEPEFQHKTFPAPTNGLVLSENLADMPPKAAVVLNNGVPTMSGVRVRGGTAQTARVGNALPTESLFTYEAGVASRMFGACDGSVYDITTPADVDVIPTAAFSGQASNYYSPVSFSNTSGQYLFVVNGTDAPQFYDGVTWAATAFTGFGGGRTQADLIQGFTYKRRLFFILKNSLKFFYLPTLAISGAGAEFELAGVFKKGGELIFGSTWSQDAGDGLDDKAVFVTDLGEVAIYEGSDPSDPTDWKLVGRYDISPPLGKNAFTHAGGDLIVMTQSGMVPISLATQKEPSQLTLSAISRPIEPLWTQEVNERTLPWEIIEIPKLNTGIVSLPRTGATSAKCLAVNLQTSRWGVYTGWDTRCMTVFNGDGYFGTSDGLVMKMETGGTDAGVPYLFQCAWAFDHLNHPGLQKTAKTGRVTYKSLEHFTPQIYADSDYGMTFPIAPSITSETVSDSLWDTSAVWDTAVWDGGTIQNTRALLSAIGVTGESITPMCQALVGNTEDPKAELTSLTIYYVLGGPIC